MNLEDCKEFHENHLDYYDMEDYQLPFDKIKSKLLNEKVIRFKYSCYEFYYPYVFYFFVAQYYAHNIGRQHIEYGIMELTENQNLYEKGIRGTNARFIKLKKWHLFQFMPNVAE